MSDAKLIGRAKIRKIFLKSIPKIIKKQTFLHLGEK